MTGGGPPRRAPPSLPFMPAAPVADQTVMKGITVAIVTTALCTASQGFECCAGRALATVGFDPKVPGDLDVSHEWPDQIR